MAWVDRQTVKKGDLGESIVDGYLINKGVIPYQPIADRAHPFDRLCASSDKRTLFVAEVKTKAARKYYPDTGIDQRHYQDYLNIWNKYGLDVWLFFVDEGIGKIYGNKISQLIIDRQINHRGRLIKYPLHSSNEKDGRPKVYFPLDAMIFVCDLTDEAGESLKEMSTRNYDY